MADKGSFSQLAVIVIAGGAGGYAVSTLGPLQETMRIALALSDNQMALLQGPALYLPPIVAAIPLGVLIDRYPRSRLLLLFIVLAIGGGVLTAIAPNFLMLLVARALVGLMSCAIAIDASALVAGFVAAEQRGRTIMMLGITQIAGMSGAFALGGKLVAFYGPGAVGWRHSMLGMMVPLVCVFILTLWVREPARASRAAQGLLSRSEFAELWRYRAMVLPLSFGPVVVGMGFIAALVWAVPIYTRQFNLAPDRIGVIMGIVLLVSGLLGPFMGGILADLCQRTGGPRRTISLMIGLALLQIPAGFFGITPTVTGVTLLLAMLCTLSYMKGVICTTVTAIVIPNELRGLCFGVQNAIGSVFVSLSPVLVSVLASRLRGHESIGTALTVVCVATSLLGAAVFWFGRRRFAAADGHGCTA